MKNSSVRFGEVRTVAALQMTPQQLRARAAQFESAIRRRKLRDLVSFAFVAVISAFGLLLDNAVVRVGAALMALWALFSMYALIDSVPWMRLRGIRARRRARPSPAAPGTAARHRPSWPWGIGLAIPGFVLVVIGLGAGARLPNWMFTAVMTGVFLFMCIALVIYGKMLAQRWQREIDSLRSLRDEPR